MLGGSRLLCFLSGRADDMRRTAFYVSLSCAFSTSVACSIELLAWLPVAACTVWRHFRRLWLNFHLWSHCWGGVTCSSLGCWVAAASISVTNEREGFRVCYSECGVVGCAAQQQAVVWAALGAAVHSDVVQPTVAVDGSFGYLEDLGI